MSLESILPNQGALLNVTENKVQIIKLVVEALCAGPTPLGQRLVVTASDSHPIEVGVGPQEIAVTHEEADVVMAYHIVREAQAGLSPIKVISDDNDVLVILAHHLQVLIGFMNSRPILLTMELCSGGCAVIYINSVIINNASIMKNLLAAHAITGCDTVSSFACIGKGTVFNQLRKFSEELSVGDVSIPLTDIISSATKFVASLYSRNEENTSLYKLRSGIFSRKLAGKLHIVPKLCSLPPTSGPFARHVMRAHFQTAIWKSANLPRPSNMDMGGR